MAAECSEHGVHSGQEYLAETVGYPAHMMTVQPDDTDQLEEEDAGKLCLAVVVAGGEQPHQAETAAVGD